MPDLFPYFPDRTRSASFDQERYESEPYSGSVKVLVRGTYHGKYSLPFTNRTQAEYDAAKAFHAAHRPPTTITYRDVRFYPYRDVTVKIVSAFREVGTMVSMRFSYTFDVEEV